MVIPAIRHGALIVYGGGSGIGLATAKLAARASQKVVIADVNAAAGGLDLIRVGSAHFVQCDVTNPADVERAFEEGGEVFGGIKSVVTTVGGAHLQEALDFDLDAWRREIAFNLDTAYIVATLCAQRLKASGGGSIVTTSSTMGSVPGVDRIGYAAAKAGVIALTKGLALAVAADGVRVNCVAPHTTDTPRLRALIGSAVIQERQKASPQGRISLPEEVAQAILFLASEASSAMTGQVIWVNNGNYMP